MTKILVILFVGLVCEAIGVVLLKDGIDGICKGRDVTLVNILPLFLKGVVNIKILLGVFFEAVFFACLLYLMSQKDISFIWPLTSLSFVVTTLAAVLYLKEHVTPARWIGVSLIMLGAGIITWNEKQTEKLKADAPVPSVAMNSTADKN
ncbi:MAG: EamA family transporter [Verrucomicrobiota bacterium]